jgi:hypothetical protein
LFGRAGGFDHPPRYRKIIGGIGCCGLREGRGGNAEGEDYSAGAKSRT